MERSTRDPARPAVRLRRSVSSRRRWAVVLAVALLSVPLPFLGGSPTPAHAPFGHLTDAAAAPSRATSMATRGPALSGSDPSGEPLIDAPLLALHQWQAAVNASHDHAGSTPTAAPPAPAPAAAPTDGARPLVSANGTITGRVYDLTHGRPILATVSVQPFGTTYCLGLCASTTTNSNGDFTLSSPAGAVVVVFSAPYFVDNRTWVTVPSGGTLGLGTLYLVHDAYVTGVVEDDLPAQAPLANVTINATSRDGTIVANPGAASAPNGSFTVAVPPVPSQVSFGLGGNPPAYLANFTWVNLTPYQNLDIGIVHLEGGLRIRATLVDASTGLPILNQSPSQIDFCSRRATICFPPVIGESGPHPTAFGLPGPAYIKARAIGYLSNITDIPDVVNTNSIVDVGPIRMTPLAAIEISSNLTGGPAPTGPWPLPVLTAYVCSLDGIAVSYQISPGGSLGDAPCWPCPFNAQFSFITVNDFSVGNTSIILGPPMHDAVILERDFTNSPAESTVPDFPISTAMFGAGESKAPGAYSNITWVNATPDRITYLGSVNVTAGTYLQGNVSLNGVTGASIDGRFEVQVCSVDVPTECGAIVGSSDLGAAVAGCGSGPGSFCAPAPAGPDEITLTEFGPGFSNRTWVAVPRGCCGQDGRPTDVGWINLTLPNLLGQVSGTVVAQTGGPGSSTVPISEVLVAVEACPVGPPPVGLPSVGCTSGVLNGANGTFQFNASLGWDEVSVHANDYQGNWTWIDVTGNNTTGVIELAPKAALVGQVRTPSGAGVYSSIIQACPVGTPLLCYTLGTSSSDGRYNGTVPGGPLPWGTYEITASSAGYATSWTWVNTTAGAVTNVPPITLWPIGSTPAPPRTPAPAANGTVGAWVDGRLVDATTGSGVPDAQILECSVVTGGCLGTVESSTAGGTFNLSVLLGQYYLEVNATGYPLLSIYVNATSGTVVHLGATTMTHYPWVHGRVVVSPWQSLATASGLGAPVTVLGCPAIGAICGPPVVTDTGGFFNASTPVGSSSHLEYIGRALPLFGTADAGFEFSTQTVAAVGTYVNLPTSGSQVATVAIFGSVSGRLTDGSTWNVTDMAARQPCGFCSLITTIVGSQQTPYFTGQVGGGGDYTSFAPSDGTATEVTGTGLTYWWTNATHLGNIPSASAAALGPIALPHYGWVTVRAIDRNTSVPISYAYVSASVLDRGNATTWTVSTLSRNDGFANVSAPLGASVNISVAAAGYFTTSRSVSVAQSQSVALGNVSLLGGAALPGVWMSSLAVNTVNTTPIATVVDAHTHAALPGADVSATTTLGVTSSTVQTNALGQFLLYAPPAAFQGLYVQLTGYDPLTTYYNTSSGAPVSVAHLNVTGDGIVAGRVLTEPSGKPAYATEVDVCPVALPGCSNYGFTNASGVFWVPGSPGTDVVSVVSSSYLTNVTYYLTVTTDRWTWVGTIPIYQFASVSGRLLGLPLGVPLAGGNVSICSPFGSPVGPCDSTVPTDANGSFFIPSPPSQYILMFQAPGYNTSYLPVDLFPGENLSVGNVFLFQYGSIVGRVVSAITGLGIPNATVFACLQTGSGICSAFLRADPTGAFRLSSPPGADLLTTTAAGYFDNYTSIFVPSGQATSPLSIALLPLSVNIPESLSGSVVAANRSNAPIPGAFVSAEIQGVTVGSGATDAAGGFTLALVWGTFSVVASAPGYVSVRSTIVLHSNLTGILFALPTQTYAVTGTVRDALTSVPLSAVSIEENGSVVTTTGPTGTYALALPNGTFHLVASATGATQGAYLDLAFVVTVAGHSVARDVLLTPSIGAVIGVVVDADSGLPVSGASVAVFGSGSTTRLGLTSVSASGAFSLTLGPGSYELNISAPGYLSSVVAVSVPGSSGPITIALVPVATTGTLGGISVPLPILIGAAVGIALAAVGIVVLRRRRPPPPPPIPRWTLDDINEPGV